MNNKELEVANKLLTKRVEELEDIVGYLRKANKYQKQVNDMFCDTIDDLYMMLRTLCD